MASASQSTYRCPNKHASTDADFCSVCGVQVSASTPAPAPGIAPAAIHPPSASPSTPNAAWTRPPACPACTTPVATDSGDFCESCGLNLRTGDPIIPEPPPPLANAGPMMPAQPPAQSPTQSPASKSTWELVLTMVPNPAVSPSSDPSPSPAPSVPAQSAPEKIIPLDADEILIGRRSKHRNISPQVSLDDDDGVSHRHAQLTRQSTGFTLTDLNSVNGTSINDSVIPPGIPIPLALGDKITLGRHSRLILRQKT